MWSPCWNEATHDADAPLVVFTAMGHPQPLYVHLVHPGFVGLGSYFVYRGLISHPDGQDSLLGGTEVPLELDPPTAVQVY